MRAFLRLLALLAAVSPFAGCTWGQPHVQKPINFFLAEPADLANVRRIMVLPFAQEAGVQADCNKVRDAFVAHVRRARPELAVPVHVMPVTMRTGDNVGRRSRDIDWYDGPTLLDALAITP